MANIKYRYYRPSLPPFLFGFVSGITIGLFFMVPLNGFIVDLTFFKFSMDRHLIRSEVGNHSLEETHHKMMNLSIAENLYNKVRVLCWILTGPKNHESKAKHVKATWGKRCNQLLFMSTEEDPNLPAVALPVIEDRDNLWGKTKEAMKHVYKHYYDKADWFFKADDDTYAVMENMRYLLYDKNPSDPVFYGFRFKPYVDQGYMSGGGGYVLSKEALNRFVNDALPDEKKCKKDNTGAEDVEMGKCLAAVGVKAGDSRDKEGRNRFMPLFITDFLIPGYMDKSNWFWSYTYYPTKEGMDCCSDNFITTHYVNPHQLYLLEYLIYHVRPFGVAYNPTLEEINNVEFSWSTSSEKTLMLINTNSENFTENNQN